MSKVRLIAAILLALPLGIFGGNHFLRLFELPEGDGGAGDQLLQAMRDGGLMDVIAASHVIVAIGLLIPRLRFPTALMQLTLTIGIVAFHATMLPEGVPFACIMLALNVVILADPPRARSLLGLKAVSS